MAKFSSCRSNVPCAFATARQTSTHSRKAANGNWGDDMTPAFLRVALIVATALAATPAFAQEAKIDPADTAWMIGATGLVLMMTIPGLALVCAGMRRQENVLATV